MPEQGQYDYTLNQILQAALLAHGCKTRQRDGKLLPDLKIPVSLDTLAYVSERKNGLIVTRLDVEAGLPDGRFLYETFGDMGGSVEEALSANWENFQSGVLNVLLDAFNQNGNAENWVLGGIPFDAYIGNFTLKFIGEKPKLPRGTLISAIRGALNLSRPSSKIHFVRFFISQSANQIDTVEIMADNAGLPFAEQALRRLNWPLRNHFYSQRLFVILMPSSVFATTDEGGGK